MHGLLSDEDPEVRVAAINGVARIISSFFLLLPTTFINKALILRCFYWAYSLGLKKLIISIDYKMKK